MSAAAVVFGLTSEADLLSYVRRTARLCGWLCYHTYASVKSDPGFPDIVLVKPPRVILAELKTQKGKVSVGRPGRGGRWLTGQDEWLDALRACPGVETFLWRPEDAQAIADTLAA